MPASKHRRPRGKPPMLPLPAWLHEPGDGYGPGLPPSAEDLRDWHPRIRREPDERQGELFRGDASAFMEEAADLL